MSSEDERVPVRLVRPRTMLYSALIALVIGIMGWAFAMRSDVEISVIEDRNPLFVRLSDGGMRNGYTLKILNKTHERAAFRVGVDGIAAARMSDRRLRAAANGRRCDGRACGEGLRDGAARGTRQPRGGSTPLRFVVTDARSGTTVIRDTTFRSPEP